MNSEPLKTCYVIAEAGVNHNGSLDIARQLIDAAVHAGADAIKFQTFRADKLVTRQVAKARYQAAATGGRSSQYEMLKALELSEDEHRQLRDYCRQSGIAFMSTPFDIDSLHFLVRDMEVTKLKLGSGDLTNGPLLLAAARSGLPLILSTGMATLADVEASLALLSFGYTQAPDAYPHAIDIERSYASDAGQAALQRQLTLLHCTTEYPAPFEQVHLRAMDTLANAFGIAVGFSDHTPGINAAVAAAARGACVIEKHLTLDKNLPGPDHNASLSPDELSLLVRAIHEVSLSLGRSLKAPATAEWGNRLIARRGLVAAHAITCGEPYTEQNLAVKRGGNISAMRYWEWLGRSANRTYAADEAISE